MTEEQRKQYLNNPLVHNFVDCCVDLLRNNKVGFVDLSECLLMAREVYFDKYSEEPPTYKRPEICKECGEEIKFGEWHDYCVAVKMSRIQFLINKKELVAIKDKEE